MITHTQYILASSSNSRKKILESCGFNFVQIKPICDEEQIKKKIKKTKTPSTIAKILSYEKAKSISKLNKYTNRYVIGCDTLINLNNKVFDKAKNLNEAKIKIKQLSGKKHKIISGVTICKDGKRIWSCVVTTQVKIRKLNSLEINEYLLKAGKKVLHSVGCYQVESLGPQIIEEIRGDFFNVMGLPLFKLLKYVSSNK